MDKKTYVVPLQNMMDDLLTCDAMGSKTFPNIFTNVPKFSSERDMYDYIVSLHSPLRYLPYALTYVAT